MFSAPVFHRRGTSVQRLSEIILNRWGPLSWADIILRFEMQFLSSVIIYIATLTLLAEFLFDLFDPIG